MKVVLAIFLVVGAAAWDYRQNGADWSGQGVCGAGGLQSPIDLPTSAPVAKEETLFFKYPKFVEPIKMYHNGYSIAATMPETLKAGFGISDKGPTSLKDEDAEAYRLWQINFHSPSEHTVEGQRLPLEVQLMHKRVTGGNKKDSDVAVVVLLFQETANDYNAFLDMAIKGGLPEKPWHEKTSPLNVGKLLEGSPYYSYKGSLTVPPCESRVKYFVRHETVPAAHSQLREFQKVLKSTCGPKGNYRNTQASVGPVTLLASVDLVNSPTFTVRPKPPTGVMAVRATQPGTALEFQCQQQLGNFEHDAFHILPGDSEQLIKAKTAHHQKSMDEKTARNVALRTDRQLKAVQAAYDAAPGPHTKIELKWQLITLENAYKSGMASTGRLQFARDNAKKSLKNLMMKECVAKAKKAEAEARARDAKAKAAHAKAKHQAAKAAFAAHEAASRRYEYSEPKLDLPTGVAASPFSTGTGSPSKVGGSAAMIAPNLQQPEMAAGGSITEAKTPKKMNQGSAKKVDVPVVTMALKLPVASSKLTKDELEAALAASGELDPKRVSLLEQSSRMRGTRQVQLVSEMVQPNSLK